MIEIKQDFSSRYSYISRLESHYKAVLDSILRDSLRVGMVKMLNIIPSLLNMFHNPDHFPKRRE